MAKIIMTNGVINVEESYDLVRDKIMLGHSGRFVTFTEVDLAKATMEKALGTKSDNRIMINTGLIQCVKS